MRKLFLLALSMFLCTFATKAYAQAEGESYEKEEFKYGVFKHLAVGAHAATTGFGLDIATDITKFLGLRAGLSVMPGFSLTTDVDVNVNGNDNHTMEAKGSIGRTTMEVLLDFYPIGNFFITGGFSFGGSRIVEITGHSDEFAGKSGSYIEIDKYQLPVDENGNINGEIKVKGVRPYIGFGIGGRAVPKHRLAFRTELGVQIHGTPKVCSNGHDVKESVSYDTEDDFSDIVDKLKFYPVLKFRLSGRIF